MEDYEFARKNFPGMYLFCGGFFNQDWDLDYKDQWDALDNYLRDSDDARDELIQDIDIILRVYSRDEIEMLVEEVFRPYYLAKLATGLDWKDWLQDIHDRIVQ